MLKHGVTIFTAMQQDGGIGSYVGLLIAAGLSHTQSLGAMQAAMILKLFGILESFAALSALVVPLLGMNLGVRVHQPRVDGRLETAQLAAIELHIDLVRAPQMSV